jgi:tetratricopeptide (TPR) repeat protein
MPTGATEIVHLAFTNHRIGLKKGTRASRAGEVSGDSGVPLGASPLFQSAAGAYGNDRRETTPAELEPWHDLSRLSELDRQRSLGLAYFAASLERAPQSDFYLARARELLEGVRDQGLREGLVAAALAQIAGRPPGPEAAELAAEALEDSELPVEARITMLYFLASFNLRNERPVQAIERLHDLMRLRRSSADWALLGSCEAARGDSRAAAAAFEKALAINPALLTVRTELARLYESSGETEKALLERRIARRLGQIAGRAASAKNGE